MTKPKTKINVKSMLSDIRSGMSDKELVKKYRLTRKQLPEVFRQLVAQGFISNEELEGRQIFQSTDDLTTAIFSSYNEEK